jgi:hypothetical protein
MRNLAGAGLLFALAGVPTAPTVRAQTPSFEPSQYSALLEHTPRAPLYDDALHKELLDKRDAERTLIKQTRAAEYARDRHFLLSLARDEVGFYHPKTGALLDVVRVWPNEPLYRMLPERTSAFSIFDVFITPEEPTQLRSPTLGCELLNRQRPPEAQRRINAREDALSAQLGEQVVVRTGRKSDYDCWADRMGGAWKTILEIYRSHALAADAGQMLSESTGSPIARSSAGAEGAFQFLSNHTKAIDNVMHAFGRHFHANDVFAQAWFASAHIAVDTKLLGSRALSESRYHAGNNVLRALHDGLDAQEQLGFEETSEPSTLRAWLTGSDITLALWGDRSLRRSMGNQFGPASYSYPAINVVNGEILDSIVANRSAWNVHAYALTKASTLSALAKETGMSIAELDSLNWHGRSWRGRARGNPLTLPKGSYVYTKQAVDSPLLEPDEFWRRETPALQACWQAFHHWNPAPSDTTGIGAQITCFSEANEPAMTYWLRVAKGRHRSDETMLRSYTQHPARIAQIKSFVDEQTNTRR